VHIPWCVRKCPYCDFNSHESSGEIPEREYIQALLQDFRQEAALIQDRQLTSIFFGGGTPSLFSGASYKYLLAELQKEIQFSPDTEITLEANPGTMEQAKFFDFRDAGINRLSIGIQSFNDEKLKALGRIHNRTSAVEAGKNARKAGFDNFNLDLMHGLPNQTLEEALVDIQQAIALKPTHLSWYQLTIEPNTAFYSAPPKLPTEDHLWEIQEQGHQLLINAGFKQYEVSAYSQPSRQSKHNLNYWQFGDYIGIGAGAHGKLTDLDRQQIFRRRKTRTPRDYLDQTKEFLANEKAISSDDLAFEFMLNAMRLVNGVPTDYFDTRTGLSINTVIEKVNLAKQKGLLETGKQLKPSEKGLQFLNELLSIFMEE